MIKKECFRDSDEAWVDDNNPLNKLCELDEFNYTAKNSLPLALFFKIMHFKDKDL